MQYVYSITLFLHRSRGRPGARDSCYIRPRPLAPRPPLFPTHPKHIPAWQPVNTSSPFLPFLSSQVSAQTTLAPYHSLLYSTPPARSRTLFLRLLFPSFCRLQRRDGACIYASFLSHTLQQMWLPLAHVSSIVAGTAVHTAGSDNQHGHHSIHPSKLAACDTVRHAPCTHTLTCTVVAVASDVRVI